MLVRLGFCVVAVKLEGPVHAKAEYTPLPPVGVDVNVNVPPSPQTVVGDTVAVIAGLVFTVTIAVVPGADTHPLASVAVKLYTPACAPVTFVLLVFCVEAVNPEGPVHSKSVYTPLPPTTPEFSTMVPPSHTADGTTVAVAIGDGLTETADVAVDVNPFPSVIVTVYTTVAATVPVVGEATTEAPVVADKPVEGAQV